MKIGLLNWSGNDNLGDNDMNVLITQKIKERGHEVVNMMERTEPHGADAFLWGGGTLINGAMGVWPPLPLSGKPIVGFGLGVSQNPPYDIELGKFNMFKNKILVELENPYIKGLFFRDEFSYRTISPHIKNCYLSYDPCMWRGVTKVKKRTYVAVNLIEEIEGLYITKKGLIEELLEEYKGEDIKGFALSRKHDAWTLKKYKVPYKIYTDGQELVDMLAGAKSAIVTKLHAFVLATVAGVPKMGVLAYAPKLIHFRKRIQGKNAESIRSDLDKDFDLALKLLEGGDRCE